MNESESGRQLGFWMCLALVVGNMIGSGIFLLPAHLAPYGLNALWGWVITIGGAMCLASVFAALAKAMPDAGGPYDYVAGAMGAPPAFLVMWSYWISTWADQRGHRHRRRQLLEHAVPRFFRNSWSLGAGRDRHSVILFTVVACTGAHVSGRVQILTSVLKIMPLVAAIVIALMWFGRGDQPAQFAPTPVSPNGIAAAAALTLWAMLGFECASGPGGSCQGPGPNHPPRDADRHTRGRPYLPCCLKLRFRASCRPMSRRSRQRPFCRSRRTATGARPLRPWWSSSPPFLPWRAQWLGPAARRGARWRWPARASFPQWFGKVNSRRHARSRPVARLGPFDPAGRRQLHPGLDRPVRVHGPAGDRCDAGTLPVRSIGGAATDGTRPSSRPG